jgi:hypothetical protein
MVSTLTHTEHIPTCSEGKWEQSEYKHVLAVEVVCMHPTQVASVYIHVIHLAANSHTNIHTCICKLQYHHCVVANVHIDDVDDVLDLSVPPALHVYVM